MKWNLFLSLSALQNIYILLSIILSNDCPSDDKISWKVINFILFHSLICSLIIFALLKFCFLSFSTNSFYFVLFYFLYWLGSKFTSVNFFYVSDRSYRCSWKQCEFEMNTIHLLLFASKIKTWNYYWIIWYYGSK